jgi:hypothetical protein
VVVTDVIVPVSGSMLALLVEDVLESAGVPLLDPPGLVSAGAGSAPHASDNDITTMANTTRFMGT